MNGEKQKSPFIGSGPARIQEMLRQKGESAQVVLGSGKSLLVKTFA